MPIGILPNVDVRGSACLREDRTAMYHCTCPREQHARSGWRWYELPLILLLLRPFTCRHCRERLYRFWWYRVADRCRHTHRDRAEKKHCGAH